MEGKEIEEVANFTRKDKAERFLNKLFKGLKKADEGVVTEHWRYKTKRAAKACLNRMMKRILASEYVTVGEAGINYFKVVGSTFAHNEFIAKYYIQQNY